MSPSQITEDYYMILEVGQNATSEMIVAAYKRLALKLHPDRNLNHDTTKEFQLKNYNKLKLGQAYDTLKDVSKRREYDRRRPSINREYFSHQSTQTSRPDSTSTSRPESLSEAAQIAALQKLKHDRDEKWRVRKIAIELSIFELRRGIRQLEQEIKILNITLAAEAVAVAQKNSWGAWLLSAIYKRAEDSEEEKARKDRGIQERRIEKDMKERWLEFRKVSLKNEEDLLRRTKEEVDAADLCDNKEIQRLRDVMRAREQMERQEKERIERERLAKIWKEHQEQREREEAERFRKTPADIYAREQTQRRKESNGQKYTNFDFGNKGNGANRTSSCKHQGWWHKV
ncbi:hypothetical protein M433DRAFT_32962, partial [Acidomyces richmondensis BFW]